MQTKSSFSASGANNGDGTIPTAFKAAEDTASGASREFQNFVADMEDLASKATSVTGEELTRVKVKLTERVAAAKQSIQEMSDAVVQGTRKSATATNKYVHDQPWQAVGIGAAVGVLFGFLLGRRK